MPVLLPILKAIPGRYVIIRMLKNDECFKPIVGHEYGRHVLLHGIREIVAWVF